jgi:hypothetical protein
MSILLSLFPFILLIVQFIFIIYYFSMVKKRKYIFTDLRSGERCYSCKDKIEMDSSEILNILVNDKKNYRLCQACQREEKLDGLINKNKSSIIHKSKLKLIDERFNNKARILLISIVFLLIVDFTLKFVFDIRWFAYFYNFFLVFYWSIMIYRHKLISIKKPSE